MQIIMTRVAARVIRATNAALPGYGASSSLRNSQNHASERDDKGRVCASVAISISTDCDNGRLANSKQIGRGVFDADADRISRRQMDPAQRSLRVGQTGS